MKRLFHLLTCLILCLLPLTATALSNADITLALDLPENVTVTGFTQSGSDAKWEKIKGSSLKKYVSSGTIPVTGEYVLQAKTCKKKDPPKTAYITMRVKGAGTLSFKYQTSLDGYNDSRIYAYLDGDSSFPEWEETGWFAKDYMTGDWFWYDGAISLDGESYTRTLTFAIECPDGDPDYYEKPDLWEDEVLDYAAWLDNFTWEEDTWTDFLVFYPDPETDSIFSDTCDIDIDSSYGNLSFYYTIDGSTPTNRSNLYNPDKGITINKTTTIKVQAYDGSDPIGKIHEATYTARLPEPSVFYRNDQIGSAQIELTSTVSGVTFYYTLDGTSPTYDSKGTPTGTTRTGKSLTLSKTTTVTAIIHKSGEPDSPEMKETVMVITPAPTITIVDEDFTGSVTATITGNGTCQYTVTYPGGQPTTPATGKSVTVTRTCTIDATAQAEGQEVSEATTRRIFLPPTLTVLCDGQPSTTNVFETSAKVTATATGGTAQFSQDKTTWATFPATGKTTNVPVNWYFRTMPTDYNANTDFCCRLPLVLQKTAPIDMTAFKDSLQDGWNLVSFPGQLSANSTSELLQAANFFALDNHVLHLATDIVPGKAYFLFKHSGLTLPDQLQAVVVVQPPIASGYSLVAPADQAPLVLPNLWKWDSIGKKYQTTTSVPAFSGAWHHQK
jgi:hypothetical protein